MMIPGKGQSIATLVLPNPIHQQKSRLPGNPALVVKHISRPQRPYCSLCCWKLVVQQKSPSCTPAAANDNVGQKPMDSRPGAAKPIQQKPILLQILPCGKAML
jgi:hypothetical protein